VESQKYQYDKPTGKIINIFLKTPAYSSLGPDSGDWIDLGSGFEGRRKSVTFLLQVTDVFQLKILWGEVQLRHATAS
jgi:hypothetical protein